MRRPVGTRLHQMSSKALVAHSPYPCQGEGRGFESRRPLQRKSSRDAIFGGCLLALGSELVPACVLRARNALGHTRDWHDFGSLRELPECLGDRPVPVLGRVLVAERS